MSAGIPNVSWLRVYDDKSNIYVELFKRQKTVSKNTAFDRFILHQPLLNHLVS